MFQALLCAEYTAYFNFSSDKGIVTCTALILAGVLIAACAAVYFAKREAFGLTLRVALGAALAYVVGAACYFIWQDFREENYTKSYQAVLLSVFIVLLVAAIVVAVLFDRKKSGVKSQTLSVVYGGLCVALAFGLSYVRLFRAPYSGSITLASLLPIALYSYMFGVRKGLICGIVYGILQAIQDPWIVHPAQFLLDYLLGFTVVGVFGGIFRKKLPLVPALALGLLVGVLARFLCSFFSGAIFFEEYMPDNFTNVWLYSLVYNATYCLPDGAIAIGAGIALTAGNIMRGQIKAVMRKAGTSVEKKEPSAAAPSQA